MSETVVPLAGGPGPDTDPPVVVVDAANVVGSRPDGWWRDRAGAAARLLVGVAMQVALPAGPLAARRVVVVLEGAARAAADVSGVEVVRADRDGDTAVVGVVAGLADVPVLVVTSDRGLRERVTALGAEVRGAGWLRAALDAQT